MVETVKLKHKNIIEKVSATFCDDIVFVFENSLPKGVIPEVGDEIILDFEDAHLSVVEVTPLLSSAHTPLDNYALRVDLV